MNHLKTIAHACIKSTDLDRTLAFYCGALGLERQFNFTKNGRVIGFYLKIADRAFVEVFETSEAVPVPGNASLSHFCLETDDMEAVREAFLAKGFQPGEIKMGVDQSRQFWITDPSGVPLEFHQYTDKSAQLAPAGHDVEVSW